MRYYIYCRVFPNDAKVGKSDKLKAQEQRCRDWLKSQKINRGWIYRDEGEFRDKELLPGLVNMMRAIIYEEEQAVILADHPARFGADIETREMVLSALDETDAIVRFVWQAF